jgi:hypothetical protein
MSTYDDFYLGLGAITSDAAVSRCLRERGPPAETKVRPGENLSLENMKTWCLLTFGFSLFVIKRFE